MDNIEVVVKNLKVRELYWSSMNKYIEVSAKVNEKNMHYRLDLEIVDKDNKLILRFNGGGVKTSRQKEYNTVKPYSMRGSEEERRQKYQEALDKHFPSVIVNFALAHVTDNLTYQRKE